MSAPDVTGFVNAQAGLRSQLGLEVVFKVPIAEVWPGGTKINPDTGEPYDPTIKPTSDPFTELTKRCLVILKQASPLRPQSDSENEASGEMSGMDIIVDIAETDYAEVEDATEMIVNELNYRIRETKPFALADTRYRRLIYGQER